MAFTEEWVTHLDGYAGLAALVGSRIYPIRIPQDSALPALAYQRIGGPFEQNIQTAIMSRGVRMQITIFGATYLSARAVATQVKAAIQAFTDAGDRTDLEFTGDLDDFDPTTETYLAMVEAVIYVRGDA